MGILEVNGQKNFVRSGLLVASAVFLTSMAGITAANASSGCYFKGPYLHCVEEGAKETTSSIAKAFATEETGKLFSSMSQFEKPFKRPIDREHFRRSLENALLAANRYQSRARRSLRHGRINRDQFNERMALYDAALKNYRSGYWFYKNSIWVDPNR